VTVTAHPRAIVYRAGSRIEVSIAAPNGMLL
jgi:hypothetical protein